MLCSYMPTTTLTVLCEASKELPEPSQAGTTFSSNIHTRHEYKLSSVFLPQFGDGRHQRHPRFPYPIKIRLHAFHLLPTRSAAHHVLPEI